MYVLLHSPMKLFFGLHPGNQIICDSCVRSDHGSPPKIGREITPEYTPYHEGGKPLNRSIEASGGKTIGLHLQGGMGFDG
jgi:hypothetical protein